MAATFILYHYTPSLVAAVIFILLFSVITLLHAIQLAIQLARFRAWFMIPVVVGGLFEATSFIGRAISHSSPQSLRPFVLSGVLSLVAPALFAATIYMTLGRIIRLLHAEHHSLIKVSRLTRVFVLFDILSFLVQSSGAGMQAGKTKGSVHLGQILVLAALFLQIVIFTLFVVVAGVFQIRTSKQPTQHAQGTLRWRRQMGGLYGASALILLRNLVRVVEYIQGNDGYISSHEWFLYFFDAVPMFAVMVLMAVIYAPSLIKQAREGELGGATVKLQSEWSKQRQDIGV